MNIENVVKQATEGRIDYEMTKAFRTGFILGRYSEQIEKFLLLRPEADLQLDAEIRLRCNSREELMDFVKTFGGNWKKELEMFNRGKLRYSQEIEVYGETILITATDAPPPPSCQVVEELVDVPARQEKRLKIVCKETGDDLPVNVEEKPEDE